jgi:hypothetical protein
VSLIFPNFCPSINPSLNDLQVLTHSQTDRLTNWNIKLRDYVAARFTHGVEEWVRPIEEFSEAEPMLAIRS